MSNTIGKIHSIETFGLVDGPGVRYVLFLQGCHMRCQYCHNPETWTLDVGNGVGLGEFTPEEAFKKAMRYKPYWGNNGGITVSGGEPLLQIDFVTEFFRLAKEKGIHTTMDTSGNPFNEEPEYLKKFDKLLEVTDIRTPIYWRWEIISHHMEMRCGFVMSSFRILRTTKRDFVCCERK